MSKLIRVFVLLVVSSALFGGGTAQEGNKKFDTALESLRADARADKVAIITEVMNLSSNESAKFWPVYREYETKVARLNDRRIALFRNYAEKFTTMNDSDAKVMANQFFDWEASRTQLRKAYFEKFMTATSAMTAAKFFQIEHRLDLLVDLQLASEMPALFIKSTGSSQ